MEPNEQATKDVRDTTKIATRDGRTSPEYAAASNGVARQPKLPARPRKRYIALGAGAAIAVIGLIFLARFIAYNRVHASTDDATVSGDIYPVSAKIGGQVAIVYVDDNDFVTAGQKLVDLDSRDLKAQLTQAMATLRTEQATAKAAGINIAITQKNSSSTTTSAQAGVRAAQAQVDAAQAQAQAGQTQIGGSQAAVAAAQAQKQASAAELGTGTAGIASAKAALEAAQSGVIEANNNVRNADAGHNSSHSALEAQDAAVNTAKQQVASGQAAIRAAQAQVDVANADVEAAAANSKKSANDLERARVLYQGGAIPQQQVDQAEAAATSAAAQERASRQRVIAATEAVGQAQAGLEAAQSGVAEAIAKRNQSVSNVTQAEVALRNSRDAVKIAETKVTQAEAGIQQAQSSSGALEADVNVQGAKVAQAGTGVTQSSANLLALRADIGVQAAKVAQAQATLEGTTVGPDQVQVSQAQADAELAKVQQDVAQVNFLKLQLSYMTITAAHDGIVSAKNVEAGQTVAAGQQLFAVVDEDSADVIANYKETQLEGMQVGDRADITVDSYPGHDFRGHVQSLSPGTGAVFSLLPPENATGNFNKVVQRVPVKIVFDRADLDKSRPLRLGMSVVATISIGENDEDAGRKPPS